MASFVGCSWSAVTWGLPMYQCITDAIPSVLKYQKGYCGTSQIICNDGNARNVSEHTMHHALLCMGLHSHKLVEVLMIVIMFWLISAYFYQKKKEIDGNKFIFGLVCHQCSVLFYVTVQNLPLTLNCLSRCVWPLCPGVVMLVK